MLFARALFPVLVLAFVIWVLVAVLSTRALGSPPYPDGETSPPTPPATTPTPITFVDPVARLELAILRRRVALQRRQLVAARRRVHTLTRTLQHSGTTREAINLACIVYGSCATLWRRASCETGGTFDPHAANPSGASGLFQFLPSTWNSTPFGELSVWSPYANALAAGWMETHGRGGEWVCR